MTTVQVIYLLLGGTGLGLFATAITRWLAPDHERPPEDEPGSGDKPGPDVVPGPDPGTGLPVKTTRYRQFIERMRIRKRLPSNPHTPQPDYSDLPQAVQDLICNLYKEK